MSAQAHSRMHPRMHPKMQSRRRKVSGAKNRRRLRWRLYPPLILLALAGLAVWLLLYSPFLDLNEVRISGLGQTDPSRISEITDQLLGDPLLTANIDDARDLIAELPWVQDVEISRSWRNGRLDISVIERTPVAVVLSDAGYDLVDIEGKILDTLGEAGGFLVVEGIGEAAASGYLNSDAALEVARELAQAPQLSQEVGAVVQDEAGKIFLRLNSGGWVYLNDTRELSSKLRSAETVLAQADLVCSEMLNVDSPLSPVVTKDHLC